MDGKPTPFHTCALLGAAATARTEAAVAFTMRRIAVRRRACLTGAKRLHGFASVNVSRACEPSLIELSFVELCRFRRTKGIALPIIAPLSAFIGD